MHFFSKNMSFFIQSLILPPLKSIKNLIGSVRQYPIYMSNASTSYANALHALAIPKFS